MITLDSYQQGITNSYQQGINNKVSCLDIGAPSNFAFVAPWSPYPPVLWRQ